MRRTGILITDATGRTEQAAHWHTDSTLQLDRDSNGRPLLKATAGGGVSGSGTTNKIPKWTAGTTLGDSRLTDNTANSYVESSVAYVGPTGSVSAPSFAFTGRTNYGMYSSGANYMSLGVNGTEILKISDLQTDAARAVLNRAVLIYHSGGQSSSKEISLNTSGPSGGGGWKAGTDDGAAMGLNDRLGFYLFTGATDAASTLNNSAGITSYTAWSWTGSSAPADLRFETTPTGSLTRTERLRITDDGYLRIVNTGDATTPIISRVADSDTGIYWGSSDDIGITSGGTSAFYIPSGAGNRIEVSRAFLITHGSGSPASRSISTNASGPSGGSGFQALTNDGAAMASGDKLGFYTFGGAYDASNNLSNQAEVAGFAAEAWSATNRGAYLSFLVTATAATTRAEVWRMDSDGTFQPNSAYGSSIGTYSLPANDVYAKRFYVHTDSTTQEAVRITKESAGKGMLAVYSSGDSLEWQFGCTETGDNNWRLTDGTNTLIDAIRGSNATVEIKSFGAGDIKLTPAANREVVVSNGALHLDDVQFRTRLESASWSLDGRGFAVNPGISFIRAEGTEASPSPLTGSTTISFGGYDGVTNTVGALISANASTTWDDSPAEHSMFLSFATREGTDGSTTWRWRIQPDGDFRPEADSNYNIGHTSFAVANLYVDKVTSVTGNDLALNAVSGQEILFTVNDANQWRIESDGDLRPESDSAFDIGSTSVAVANIYTDKLSSITGNDLALNAVTGQQIAFKINDVTEGTLSATATDFSGTTLAWGGGSAISSSNDVLAFPIANNTWMTWDDSASGENAINVLKVDSNDDTVLNADSGDQIIFQIGGSDVGVVGSGGGLNWRGGRIMTQIDGEAEHWGMEETGGASVNSPRYAWKYSADTPGRAYMIGWDGSASDYLMRFEMVNDASVIEMLPFDGGTFKFGDPPTTQIGYDFRVFGDGMSIQTDTDQWLALELVHNDDASGNWCGMGVTTHESSSNESVPIMWLLKCHGTYGSPAATEAGDVLGRFDYGGWAPTEGYGAVGARIHANAPSTTGNWAAGDTPGEIHIATTPNGSNTPVDHFTIQNDGYLVAFNTGYMGMSILNKDSSVSQGSDLYIENWGSTGAPVLAFYHPEGTHGSPSATTNNKWLGYLDFAGYGSAYATGARIYASTNETWSGSQHGTTLFLQTKNSGSTSLTTRMTINANGNVVFGDNVAVTVRDATLNVLRDDVGDLLDLTAYGYVPMIDIQRAAGNEGSPSAVPAWAGQQIRFKWYDGSSFEVGALISGATTEAWDSASHGARLQFQTRDKGSGSSLTDRWNISDVGDFLPSANNTYDIGSGTYRVDNAYIKRVLTPGAILGWDGQNTGYPALQLDGTDADPDSNFIGIYERGGGLYGSARGSIVMSINADATSGTNHWFGVYMDGHYSGGSYAMRVFEDGELELYGQIDRNTSDRLDLGTNVTGLDFKTSGNAGIDKNATNYLALTTDGIQVAKTQYNSIYDIGAQGGDFDVDWRDGNHQYVTLTNSSTQDVTFSNIMAGGIVTLVMRRSSNSGSLTWLQSSGQTATVDWGTDGAPSIPTVAGNAIVLTFIAHSTTEIIGVTNGVGFTLADI